MRPSLREEFNNKGNNYNKGYTLAELQLQRKQYKKIEKNTNIFYRFLANFLYYSILVIGFILIISILISFIGLIIGMWYNE